ncbi:LysR family transcriptional regulator [Paracidovorax avenae]
MDLSRSDIAAFIEVVRSGGFSRAAINLGVTQPSVSKALRRLEDSVGVSLLERGVHGVRLTSEGQLFLEAAKRLEAQHLELGRLSSELRARHSGLLRLGITSPSSDSIAVLAVSDLVRRRPGMRLRMHIGKSDELNAKVEDGELDLAVVPSYQGQSLSCSQIALSQEEMRLVVRAGHPLAQLASVGLQHLTPFAWVMPSQQSAALQALQRALQQNGAPAPHVALEPDYVSEAVMGIITRTDLLSMVPASVLRNWLGRVTPLSVPELQIHRTQVLLSRPQATWSALMTDLRDLLLSYRDPRQE